MKVQKQPTTVEEWLEARKIAPTVFGVTDEGDFRSPPIREGETAKIIVPSPQVPATSEVIENFFQGRLASVKDLEARFAAARRELKATVDAYRAGTSGVSASDVLIANRGVQELDQQISQIMKSPRSVAILKGVPLRDIEFDVRYVDRSSKVNGEVMAIQSGAFPWKAFYMDPVDEAETAGSNASSTASSSGSSSGSSSASSTAQSGGKVSKTPQERARIGAIIRARTMKKRARMGHF